MQKRTLVIGASENPDRYSNKAIKKLNANNHPVIAIGLKEGEVDGIKIKKELGSEQDVHTVTMYVGPKNQSSYFNIIAELKPARIILNPGTENSEIEEMAKANNIEVIHGCTLVMLSTNQY